MWLAIKLVFFVVKGLPIWISRIEITDSFELLGKSWSNTKLLSYSLPEADFHHSKISYLI
jgi:hypothetical protein